jgi:hypothetical protein
MIAEKKSIDLTPEDLVGYHRDMSTVQEKRLRPDYGQHNSVYPDYSSAPRRNRMVPPLSRMCKTILFGYLSRFCRSLQQWKCHDPSELSPACLLQGMESYDAVV